MGLIDLNPERSVIALPGVQAFRRASDNKWVTPALGKSGVREVLLGSDGATSTQFPSIIKPRGFSFDGGDQLNAGDSDSFSFTDGVNDKPFSVVMLESTATAGTLVDKSAGLTSSGEYIIYHQSSGRMLLTLFLLIDESSGKFIGRYDTVGRTPKNIQSVMTFTYDGSKSMTGIKIYRDNTRIDNANLSNGAYAGMRNTTKNLTIGRNPLVARIVSPMLFDFELSLAEVQALTERYRSLYSITPR